MEIVSTGAVWRNILVLNLRKKRLNVKLNMHKYFYLYITTVMQNFLFSFISLAVSLRVCYQ